MLRRSVVLAVALALDSALGEPPAALHPVVWFGRLVALLERRARRGTPRRELASGTALTIAALLIAWRAARAAEAALVGSRRKLVPACPPRSPTLGNRKRTAIPLAGATALLTEAWLLKTTLSLRALAEAAAAVQQALGRNDLATARSGLLSLVSRDVAALEAPLLAAAAIESVAENASDALVAPALAYAVFGLPGAVVYRGVNTLDAMVGYRGAYEWLGKVAARLDDVANLIPSRLTAVFLAIAAGAGRGRRAWRVARNDHGRTASPNAGWPMSAMAGALGLELEKLGHYRLGAPARQPEADDIGGATQLLRRVAALTLVLVAVTERLSMGTNGGGATRGHHQPSGVFPATMPRPGVCRKVPGR
jgi:adenosylcobinamide-phosphate synthase